MLQKQKQLYLVVKLKLTVINVNLWENLIFNELKNLLKNKVNIKKKIEKYPLEIFSNKLKNQFSTNLKIDIFF